MRIDKRNMLFSINKKKERKKFNNNSKLDEIKETTNKLKH